jgi:hypothetical protein
MKIFIEEQKFTQPLVIVGLSMAFIVVGISTYSTWGKISNGSIGEQIGALSGLIIITLISLLFLKLKLKTRIDEMGIHYQFYPFQFSYKKIVWNSISTCTIRNYNAFSEFGGWGMKRRIYGKGRCYTTKGNIGLQLELKNGKKKLIGTQKKDELQRVLNTYQHKLIEG